MLKVAALIIMITVYTLPSNAQEQESSFQIAAGLRLGVPVGSFSRLYKPGIGPEVQLEARLAQKLKGVLSGGYVAYKGKKYNYPGGPNTAAPTLGTFPFLVGLRVYPVPRYFVGGKFGISVPFGAGDDNERETGFNYEPHIGANISFIQLVLGYTVAVNDYNKQGRIILLALIRLKK